MTQRTLIAICLASAAATSVAQTAIDAYTITPTELRGSARFVGMGGAFTSLGGDLSCMTQNPAGLGIYRTSDVGLTFDISMRNSQAKTNFGTRDKSNTKATFDNFGYVGVANLSGAMRTFTWGVSYNRLAVFDRYTNGYNMPTSTSMSNYIASATQGVDSNNLLEDNGYDPYYDSAEDWLSILAYNSYMINNSGSDTNYQGLFKEGTEGDAAYQTHEWGHTDEYNIDFAGNVNDVVFWGLGIGIVDMNYSRESYYTESMANAAVYDPDNDIITNGNAGFALDNNKYISGTGTNLKLGLIARPIEMLRIGVAFHTPTWYTLSHSGYANAEYNYTPDATNNTYGGSYRTPSYDYRSKLESPWKFMAGASIMIGSSAIISADYEYVAYDAMKLKQQAYGSFWDDGGYEANEYANQDVKALFRAANIVRLGAEVRLSKHFSVRAGYNFQRSAVKKTTFDGSEYVSTAGLDPAYQIYHDTQNVCLGIGYRYQAWYIDLAYQYVHQTGQYQSYSSYNNIAPGANTTYTRNNIVISTGIRF